MPQKKQPGKMRVRVIQAQEKPIAKAETPTHVDLQDIYNAGDWIQHPYDMRALKKMVKESTILPQCIKAYKNNIAGFGIGVKYNTDEEETPEMKAEFDKMTEIIELLNTEQDTKEVFEDLIESRETYGIAYLEVVRNLAGEVVQIDHIREVPSIHKTKPLGEYITTTFYHHGMESQRQKRYCIYRQEIGGFSVYFKEFGDPRIMDKRTGRYLEKNERLDLKYQANEILEFAIGTEPYGEVRWEGQLLGVDGSRRAENLNNNYFINGRHTPLLIMIQGGTLTDESYEKLAQYMNGIRGENGQHAFLLLETESTDNRTDFDSTEKPTVEIKDLANVLQKDELFQDYLDNHRRKVQSAFQLPDIYTGYTTDFNRATSQMATQVTEQQVFQPERLSLAWAINNRLLNGYNFKYVEAYFKEPMLTNPDDTYRMLSILNSAGGLTMNKAKDLLYKQFGEESENYDADWGDMPLQMAKTSGGGYSPEQMEQAMQKQIEKAAKNHDDEIVAVMREVKKALTSNQNGETIRKGWVTTEDGERVYIGGGGKPSGGSAGYAQYQQDVSDGTYTPTPKAGENGEQSTPQPTKSEVRGRLEDSGIAYKEVQMLDEKPSESEIISKIGGPDRTKGSCSSLAFAYMAQENQMDVTDYRGGQSQDFFSRNSNILDIAELEGVDSTIEETFNEQKTTMKMLGEMEENTEYYLATGRHAAIVRNTGSGYEYLELQSGSDRNGWHELTRERLKSRFGATQSRSVAGIRLTTKVVMINSESLSGNEEYRQIMGYINTDESKQKKGSGGRAK